MSSRQDPLYMSFGEHLEIMRQMLFRIVLVVVVLAGLIFCFKDETFAILLAPKEYDFVTFRLIERMVHLMGVSDFHFEPYHISLISTELSAQFMMHLSSSVYLGLLLSSPYILYELFRFVTPALYDNERRYSVVLTVALYVLFVVGVLMNYYVIFPISFRFLGTYQVSEDIVNTITLESYVSTFSTLTFTMGLVFELPVVAFIMAKLGLVTSSFMSEYRRHAFVLIMVVAAIITPPDVFTLVLVSIPLYLLYESCIIIVRRCERQKAVRG